MSAGGSETLGASAPVKSHRAFAHLHPNPAAVRAAMAEVDGFNAKLAVLITKVVGSMWCAYAFCVLALLSLPAILIEAGVLTKSSVPAFLTKPGLILIVAWVAQTFLQLVLLSVIMVGQAVQQIASDKRSEQEFHDTELILAAMDVNTEGGLHDVVAAINQSEQRLLAALAPPVSAVARRPRA